MKKQLIFGFLFLIGGLSVLQAQVLCLKPTAMSEQQLQLVAGKWSGTYTRNGTRQETDIIISVNQNKEVICTVSNPPVVGQETSVDYFFCPVGEFHLRKSVGNQAYVFQGVPEKGHIRGSLSLFTRDNKRIASEEFVLHKVE